MKVYYPENLFKTLKQKHLLLDTNVFIDSFNFDQPQDYSIFFNDLKDNFDYYRWCCIRIFKRMKRSIRRKTTILKE
jgi:hypothetical protein